MKIHLVKLCLPIVALSLAFTACGKKHKSTESKTEGAPVLSVPTIDTQFEADCGADVVAASATETFDTTACQLTPEQRTYLQGVGPFKVVADCKRQSIQIINATEQLKGSGSLDKDGNFSVKLKAGSYFSAMEGCPVRLQGIATGIVACDEHHVVKSVKVNTAFDFAHVPVVATSNLVLVQAEDGQASELELPESPQEVGKQELPKAPEKGNQEMPKEPEEGKQELPKVPEEGKQELPKGKGNQEQGQTVPTNTVRSCVSFAPCAFNASASLSCSR